MLTSYLVPTTVPTPPQLIDVDADKKISLAEWEAFISSTELPPAGAEGGSVPAGLETPTPMKKPAAEVAIL